MTGYHADTSLLQRLGAPVDPVTGVPSHDETTMATPVPGCYLAGVIASGNDANRLFIENARGHGELIVRHVLQSRDGVRPIPSQSADPISASSR
jgi:thioredoxin reductase (NADPH)